MRNKFMIDTTPWSSSMANPKGKRSGQENISDILKEYPFRIRYENERAVDSGGVCQGVFSSFWEEVYLEFADSSNTSAVCNR